MRLKFLGFNNSTICSEYLKIFFIIDDNQFHSLLISSNFVEYFEDDSRNSALNSDDYGILEFMCSHTSSPPISKVNTKS